MMGGWFIIDSNEDLAMSEEELAELLEKLPEFLQELEVYSASG